MSDLDRLPPDQRAVLSLVLDRGKSYGEVAEMLGISESVVRDRARAALDALADDPARLNASGSGAPTRAAAAGVGGAAAATGSSEGATSSSEAGAASAGESARGTRPPHGGGDRGALSPGSSRLGGALLLGGIVVAIVVAVILISNGGGKTSSSTPTAASNARSTSTSTSPSSAAKPHIDKKLTLASVEPTLKASGEAYVLSEGSRLAFYIAARGLTPSSGFFYAVWLYNSPSSSAPLGRAPAVGSNGRMEGGGPLPSNARDYAKLIVTRETSTHASRPGQIVLSGAFALR
jgi:hypothetical protein